MNPVKVSEVLDWVKACGFSPERDFKFDQDFDLTGFASVDRAGKGDVTFWVGDTARSDTNANGFSNDLLRQISAGLIFVPSAMLESGDGDSASLDAGIGLARLAKLAPNVRCIVPVLNPYHVMVEFLNKFVGGCSVVAAVKAAPAGVISAGAEIHPSAVVDGSVGDGSYVGPNCVVMAGASIGANCILEANVTIYPNVSVGDGCVFQAGSVIGSRGFGFYEFEGKRRMVPHVAGVRIGNNCSFSANMVVAAGFISPTVIGNDCHFDTHVQVAHNCVLGNNIYMASQSGLAGTVTVEDDVELAGGAQTAGHLTIGKGAHVAAKAGVTKSVPAGHTVAGFPTVDIDVWRRSMVKLRMLGKK